MGMNFIFFQLLTILLFPLVNSLNNSATDSLNFLVQDFALKTLVKHRPHTGVVYKTIPPANLSGMEVSVVRLRSRRLWQKGANFSYFSIPPRTLSFPHVRRLALVYQDLGNWSSHYYTVPGYSLLTSVVGFMVFDASDVSAKSLTKLSLSTAGKPILISFPKLVSGKMISNTRCVHFAANGTTYLSEMSFPGVCHSKEQGHFSIVVPLPTPSPSPSPSPSKGKQNIWHWWVIGFVLGLVGLVVMSYAGMVLLKLLRTKKIQIMERQADEDLVLPSRWVGQSKMPSAAVTRTQPVLEDGCFT
ncbi:hypothetical protein UlMin_002080 [Ulmus minor]